MLNWTLLVVYLADPHGGYCPRQLPSSLGVPFASRLCATWLLFDIRTFWLLFRVIVLGAGWRRDYLPTFDSAF